MRHFMFFLFCLAVLIVSCKKEASTVNIPNGIYSGTFQRLTDTGGVTSNVSISIVNQTWEGQSQFPKYPALCRGIYKYLDADSMYFENSCPWTAEFDWSLILSGNYKVVLSGKSLEISRKYSNVYLDIYKLTRQ